MILRPEDYLRATEAVMADIARGKVTPLPYLSSAATAIRAG